MKFLKKLVFVFSILLSFTNTQCEDDAVFVDSDCDQTTIIDLDLYDNLETAFFTFVSADIQNDCLIIEISASGCDGNSWTYNLIDSSDLSESSPPQRYLKFQLVNNEACLAVFQNTVSFDLSPLRVNGNNEIILNIDGLEMSLTYTY